MTENSVIRCKKCGQVCAVRETRKEPGHKLTVEQGKVAESAYGFCKCNPTTNGALVFWEGSLVVYNEEFAILVNP